MISTASRGLIRALRHNAAAGTIVEGGRTITQQLVMIRFLGHERTLQHKLREALVAAWLELSLGKNEILTRYLNSVYLGNGAYGMSAAARLYFGKRLSELTLPEAAMLAGLIRAPRASGSATMTARRPITSPAALCWRPFGSAS